LPLLVNNSHGVVLNGNKQFIWCNYTVPAVDQPQTVGYLYFNDNTDYVCVDQNETYEVEMNIDEGNGTSYGNPFDNNTLGVYHLTINDGQDSSTYGNTAGRFGDPYPVKGKIGLGQYLDGAGDYFNAGDIQELQGISNLTVCAWFNFTNTLTDAYIVSKQDGSLANLYSWYLFKASDQKIKFASWTTAKCQAETTTALTTNTLYHSCGTFDGDKVDIYLNGIFNDTDDCIDGTLQSNNKDVLIGAEGRAVPTSFFMGVIDEVRLYNRTLSPDEIYALYNSTSALGILEEQNVTPTPNITNVTNVTYSNLTFVYDLAEEMPIERRYCSGDNRITIRQRLTCYPGGCFYTNQTETLYCSNGCEEDLSIYGAECVPIEFDILTMGWLLGLGSLLAILYITFKLKRVKKKKRWV
jgi:hypothetical protein